MSIQDIFYPYKTLENQIEINFKSLNENSKFNNNILNFYEIDNEDKINLKVTAKIDNIEDVLAEKYKKNYSENLDLILLIKSIKSLTRKFFKFEQRGNIFVSDVSLKKEDWRGDVNISATLVLKKKIEEIDGYAFNQGTQLGWSTSYKILFDEPEEKIAGEGMEVLWESFKSEKLFWLQKHYYKNIYAIDLKSASRKLPKVYLNEDMDIHLKSLLKLDSTKSSAKNLYRDLMFQNIATGVFVQLMTHCLLDFYSELKFQKNSPQDKEIIIENAWQDIALWQRKIIENYATQLSPDSRKKDALDNLKEKLFDSDTSFPEVINVIQNIAQNNQGTEKLFTQVSQTLLTKFK